jgi:hypothetical protein
MQNRAFGAILSKAGPGVDGLYQAFAIWAVWNCLLRREHPHRLNCLRQE